MKYFCLAPEQFETDDKLHNLCLRRERELDMLRRGILRGLDINYLEIVLAVLALHNCYNISPSFPTRNF